MFYINRLEKDIKYKISFIFLKFINDKRLKDISILDVKLYKDLSIIKIYVMFYNNNSYNKTKILNNSSKFIQKKLFKNMNIKKNPKLLFINDISINNAYNIINIINKSL